MLVYHPLKSVPIPLRSVIHPSDTHKHQILYVKNVNYLWEGAEFHLQACFTDMKKSFSKATLVLLFLSIFALAVIIAPVAMAQSITVTLSPSSGAPGAQVIVYASNYPIGDTTFSVKFGSTAEPSIYTGTWTNTGSAAFNVPTVSTGKYTVTVTDQNGVYGTATFTVTQPPLVVITPGPTGSSTGTGTASTAPSGTTYYPVAPYGGVPSKSGFWSPLAIGIVALVVAVACFTTVVFVRRGRQGPGSAEAYSNYKPQPSVENTQTYASKATVQATSPYGYRSSTQTTSPYGYRSSTQTTSPYGYRSSVQPTRSTAPPQFNQDVTSRPAPPTHTKVCKYCKRDVRDDFSVCPYCFKKLK
jgi:hypothetical protein